MGDEAVMIKRVGDGGMVEVVDGGGNSAMHQEAKKEEGKRTLLLTT